MKTPLYLKSLEDVCYLAGFLLENVFFFNLFTQEEIGRRKENIVKYSSRADECIFCMNDCQMLWTSQKFVFSIKGKLPNKVQNSGEKVQKQSCARCGNFPI